MLTQMKEHEGRGALEALGTGEDELERDVLQVQQAHLIYRAFRLGQLHDRHENTVNRALLAVAVSGAAVFLRLDPRLQLRRQLFEDEFLRLQPLGVTRKQGYRLL